MARKYKHHFYGLVPLVENVDEYINSLSKGCFIMILDMCEFLDIIEYDVSQWRPELIFEDDIAAKPHLDVLFEERAKELQVDERALRNEVENLKYGICLLIMQCIGKAWLLLNKDWDKVYLMHIPDLVKGMIDNFSENPGASFALTDDDAVCKLFKVTKER